MMKTVLWVATLLAVTFVAAVVFLGWRFELTTEDQVARLNGAPPATRTTLSFAELDGLPAPVQRYFRAVLKDGMTIPHTARIAQAGQFLIKPPDKWVDFVSVEYFTANPAGFVWDARMDMARGLPVKVRDAYVDGTGSMQAAIWGAIPLVDVVGTPDIAQGALARYLAEGPWFPVALLPSSGVQWTPIDEVTAQATLTSDDATVAVEFSFDSNGMIERVYCAARMRDVDGKGVPTPWQGRLGEYSERDGMVVPTDGEVAWLLPEGEQVYWKGRVTDAQYE